MTYGRRLLGDTVRSVGFAAIAAGATDYVAIGLPLAFKARQILIQNYTDVPLMFSFNGTEGDDEVDQFPLLSRGYLLLDVTSNKVNEEGFFIAEGTEVSVRYLTVAPFAVPTTGGVFVSVFYGKGD